MDCARLSAKIDTFYWVDAGDGSLSGDRCPKYTVTYRLE
jgi:hypothetical protein